MSRDEISEPHHIDSSEDVRMSMKVGAHPYSQSYYETGLGPTPYNRHEGKWLQFFGLIADHVVKQIGPRKVLDAGCAKGFLVEALRDRGVEAYGIDLSEYAIGEVRRDIRPYCRVSSLVDPSQSQFDLILCIEVLEHLPEEEGRRAIANLCRSTDDIIFSSTPDDFTEATHVNVQPRSYWDALFSSQGFDLDTDFDATFVSPQAMRFTRRATRLYTVDALLEQRERLRKEFRRSHEEKSRLNDCLAQRLTEIEQSIGWRLVARLKDLRERMAPLKSRRLEWYLIFRHWVLALINGDWRTLFKQVLSKDQHSFSQQPDHSIESQWEIVQPLPIPISPESTLAHSLLDGLKGLEIGAATHNPFGLNTKNVELRAAHEFYANEQRRLSGLEPAPVHLWASADSIPVPDQSEGFVLTSHILEHLPNIVVAFLEWDRIVIDGGYVFMIVPHKWALPADSEREATAFEHFISDYTENITADTHPIEGVPGGRMGHYHTFSPGAVLQVVEWMCQNKLCDWRLVSREDIDSKVGNGFTLAFMVRHQA